ncbi:MotA/TolQ/ExbB proton channel family protein [Sphingomonas sp.]|uniref:MotA/TolQ/ExbB proton channel family protein n=1 Tax=Sphingomonas sp. TaxID=28214 RepID=UPI003CC6036D
MQLATFFDPTALAIVGGGTALTTILRSPVRDLMRAAAALTVLPRRRFAAEPLLRQLAAQAYLAGRHGVMQLDRAVIADPDLAAAIDAIVDGATPETVVALAEHCRRARIERHAAAADVWAGAADAAPAMGMVGTLVGLAAMFATMADPAKIGGAMAVALLATLYGALLANLVAQPIAHRLRVRARIEAYERSRLSAPLAILAAREAPSSGTVARVAA